jgi:alpha-1,2-mannosyltransferase
MAEFERMPRERALEFGRLAIAAAAFPLAGWLFWAFVRHLGPNDFHDYWLAGKLLLDGVSPYDRQAMADMAVREHLSFSVGGGYSYPLPFAVAIVPLALLPFDVAATVFIAASIVAFGVTVAALIGWAFGFEAAGAHRRLGVALAAGMYLPVYGSVAMGQANLILFPLLGAGAVLALDGATPARRALGGLLLGFAAIVKLVPALLIVPLALGRRFGAAGGIAAGALGAFAVAVAAVPWAAAGSGGLTSLLDPDPFYSNQSINGFVTRLVAPSGISLPIWSGGFDPRPVVFVATAAFGLATAAVLWRARAALRTRRGAALGLGLALVAGIIGAPKTSFWNESIVLVGVAVMLAVERPDLRFGRLGSLDCALLAAWFATAVMWAAMWALEPPSGGPLSAAITLAWSVSLYGLLALWLLFARRLGMSGPPSAPTIS